MRKCGATWTDKIWHITEGYLNPSTTYSQGTEGEGAGYVLSLLTLAIFLTFNESYKTVRTSRNARIIALSVYLIPYITFPSSNPATTLFRGHLYLQLCNLMMYN